MIRLEHATVILEGRRVLDDVSFTLDAGDMLLVIGPPEGGKTTLVRALAGLVPLSAGRLFVDDREVNLHDLASRAAWQRQVGVAFQNDALFDASTTFQNVAFPLQERGVSEGEQQQKVRQRLEEVGLWPGLRQAPGRAVGWHAQTMWHRSRRCHRAEGGPLR